MMVLKRFLALFNARTIEFLRDRAGFGWNFVFPFFIVIGFSVLFDRGGQPEYKVGVIPAFEPALVLEGTSVQDTLTSGLFNFIEFNDRAEGLERLRLHKLDMVVEQQSKPLRYWINESSPAGLICESLLLKAVQAPETISLLADKQTIYGRRISYIDWLFPGIIAMNMMFSALYGAGHVVVRYRKIGVLKRLKATPVRAVEYLTAQVISRILIIIFSGVVLYAGCAWLLGFQCLGSYLDLLLIYTLGGMAVIALGLMIAARISNEEVANGLLNMISWPMMFLSEVWFSIEGSPGWIHQIARAFPLTHVTEGMRRIINEGASLSDLGGQIGYLTAMTLIFLIIGSLLFKWTRD